MRRAASVPRAAAGFAVMLAVAAEPAPSGAARRRTDSPLDHLSANVEILTRFGERADFSPDGHRVAFMAKSFGDAFVIDLATRQIRCLTCAVPGAAFLRVMHLAVGGYLLIGPERFEDVHVSRARDNELWFQADAPGARPVRVGRRMAEGAAVSKRSSKIAFAVGHGQDASIPEGRTQIVVADLDVSGGEPVLRGDRVVVTSEGPGCSLEAQDFFDEDRRLTYSCYEPEGRASVWTVDLSTGERINHSAAIGSYNEVEGIFPDGQSACVESDHQSRAYGDPSSFRNIDVWKLRLDGTGRSFTRLTTFNDHEGWKASNPVVSPDGRLMAFQVARTADEAGVGYGILLMRLEDARP
jgi:Tol biopolymer transport system component